MIRMRRGRGGCRWGAPRRRWWCRCRDAGRRWTGRWRRRRIL